MTDNAYLATDIAYADEQDREWLRDLAIEQRAAEILADPRELDIAIGEQVYGAIPFDPESFIKTRAMLAGAKDMVGLIHAGVAMQKEFERIATRQAEVDLYGEQLPALLRRQAE